MTPERSHAFFSAPVLFVMACVGVAMGMMALASGGTASWFAVPDFLLAAFWGWSSWRRGKEPL
jgi:hypothetical protein